MTLSLDFDEHVLVTGGAGFIGSHLLHYLVLNYPNKHFTCFDKLSYASNQSTQHISALLDKPNFTFVKLDLASELDRVRKFLVDDFPSNQITTIINLAAESCVDRSFVEPLHFTTNNILGTQNLLECARTAIAAHSLQNQFIFIHISTDEVYGEQDDSEVVDETDKLNPTNPYAATKAAIDLIIKSYQYSYKLPVAIIRSNNVYGEHQYPEKIIPTTIDRLKHIKQDLSVDRKIPLHGNGSNRRSYLNVSDFVRGVVVVWDTFKQDYRLGQHRAMDQIFNSGSPYEIDNLSLVKMIIAKYLSKKYGVKSPDFDLYIQHVQDRNYNDSRYAIKFNKMQELGWSPQVSLEDGLDRLIQHELQSEPVQTSSPPPLPHPHQTTGS